MGMRSEILICTVGEEPFRQWEGVDDEVEA